MKLNTYPLQEFLQLIISEAKWIWLNLLSHETNMFHASFHITSTITEKNSNDRCYYWSNGGHLQSDRALVTVSAIATWTLKINLENDSHDDARASIGYHWAKLPLAETWYIRLCTSLKRFWGNAAYLCNLLYFDRNMP